MTILVVGSDPAIKATFQSRRYGDDGWLDSYDLQLDAINFRASLRIQNPGYGHPPSQLFTEMAESWRGWPGVKSWAAMDGELEIEATADSIGHVTFKIIVPGYEGSQLWSAEARLLIEAGQLERLAREAEVFFGKRVT